MTDLNMRVVVKEIFTVPTELPVSDGVQLAEDLTTLWRLAYGVAPGILDADLSVCRSFFDPVARGHKLRERLTTLQAAPPDVAARIRRFGEPLVIDAGSDCFLVGLEARLILDLLAEADMSGDLCTISPVSAFDAQCKALEIYRKWSLTRLVQVIDLRAGRGAEPIQLTAVGVVLALLINRSDSPERAIVQWHNSSPDGSRIDDAIHSSAVAFGDAISPSKRGRSSTELKLRSGYHLTEARRRLAHRICVVKDDNLDGALIYIREDSRAEVIEFIARDLARRSTLTHATLQDAFDRLVEEFRSKAGALAYRSMVFERPGDTSRLKSTLLKSFDAERASGNL